MPEIHKLKNGKFVTEVDLCVQKDLTYVLRGGSTKKELPEGNDVLRSRAMRRAADEIDRLQADVEKAQELDEVLRDLIDFARRAPASAERDELLTRAKQLRGD